MRRLFIFIVFLCANFSAKTQNAIDSINQKVVEVLEKKYLEHQTFFETSGDTMFQTVAIKNAIVSEDLFYIFSVKKVKNNFVFISITEMSKKKSNGSYIFQKDKFFYKKDTFEVEVIADYFAKKNKEFLDYLEKDK